MAKVSRSERTLFLDALELPAEDQRQKFLDEACGNDLQLRQRIESLLAAHDSSQEQLVRFGFDEAEHRSNCTAPHHGPFELVSDYIGPYKLLEQIGEGGFAIVFLGEQQHPVRRQVALKIIKPGMDTRACIARFEAERQALAMMDHPNIAKVFDAGATESGRPYFVMELVRGVPITEYCEQCNLTIRERLNLIITVCEAVQHAHQKGVIHRDIKPNNVLVAMQGGRASPKVIDFGVAKAISQRLTEHSIATGFSQIVGTPLYMSPEQAEMSRLGVDTRSDIYSLGVLLYQLLTGTTPFDKQRLQSAPYIEMRRIICEEEPLIPSARFSTLSADLATTIVESCRTDLRRIVRAVRGDLDWIVMRCLEKDRSRRYETANGLARDIERYLKDEPVRACPPSAAYRIGKFARRNKLVLVAVAAIVAALLLLVVGLTISNRKIVAERNQKAQALEAKEQALAEKEQAFQRAEAERQRAEKNFRQARIAVRGILSDAARGIGDWSELSPSLREKFAQETVDFYESFLRDASDDPSLLYETAVGYRSLSAIYNSVGNKQKSADFLRRSIDILEQLSEQYPENVNYRHQMAFNQYALGWRLRQNDQWDNADAALQKSADLYAALISERPEHGSYYLEWAACLRILIQMQDDLGTDEGAQQSVGQLARLLRLAALRSPDTSEPEMFWRLDLVPKFSPTAPIAPKVLIGVAQALIDVGRVTEAISVCREIVDAKPDDAAARYCLAHLLETDGQFDEAIAELQQAIESQPDYPDAHNGLAWLLANSPKSEFRDPQRAVIHALRATELAPDNPGVWNTLGVALFRAGDYQGSKLSLRKSLELQADDSFVLFFLAMDELQLGDEVAAKKAYQQAIEWMENQRPNNEVLRRFRREATELLGMNDL